MKAIRVNKLRVGSFAKVVAITQAIIAFVYGTVLTLAVIAGQITEQSSVVKALGVGIVFFSLAIVILPVLAYIIGWIQGAIASLILNFVFSETGGLEIEIEDAK